MGVSSYLIKLIKSYFSKRLLWYDTEERPKQYTVTEGLPFPIELGAHCTSSSLGEDTLFVPKGAKIISFTDYLA